MFKRLAIIIMVVVFGFTSLFTVPLQAGASDIILKFIDPVINYYMSNYIDMLYGVAPVWTSDDPIDEKWNKTAELYMDTQSMPLDTYWIYSYMANHKGDVTAGANLAKSDQGFGGGGRVRSATDTTPDKDIPGSIIPDNTVYNLDGIYLIRSANLKNKNISFDGVLYETYQSGIQAPILDFTPANTLSNTQIDNGVAPYCFFYQTTDKIACGFVYDYNLTQDYSVITNRTGFFYPFSDSIYGTKSIGKDFTTFPTTCYYYNSVGTRVSHEVTQDMYMDWMQVLGFDFGDHIYTDASARTAVDQFFNGVDQTVDDLPIVGGDTYIEYSPKYITNYNTNAPQNSTYYLDYGDDVSNKYFNYNNEDNSKSSLINLIPIIAGAVGAAVNVSPEMELNALVDLFGELVGQLNASFQTGDLVANVGRLLDIYAKMGITPYIAVDNSTGDIYVNPDGSVPVATSTPDLPVKFKQPDDTFFISDDDDPRQLPTYDPIGSNFPVYYRYPLARFFPFSIPFDFLIVVQGLVAEPEAPQVPIVVPTWSGDGSVSTNTTILDFSRFDSFVSKMRPVVLLLAVVGVLLGIKKFMF